jgi:hypothetical protein
MSRKQKHQLTPRRKRMTRQGRLDSARATGWLQQYGGKNIIKSYGKWFGVDPLCAIMELRMLGATISEERENRVKALIEARTTAAKHRSELSGQGDLEELYSDCDDTFAYIAGYTPGGAPYGVTWEELGEKPPWKNNY